MIEQKYYMEPKDGEIFCDICGTANDTANGEMHCKGCGSYLGEMFCGVCGKFINEGERYVLSNLPHVFDSQNPDLYREYSAESGFFCCEEHALIGVKNLYDIFGINLKLPEILTINKCENCGTPFEVDAWNKSLTLSVERGPRYEKENLGIKYLAHFCPTCGRCAFWISPDSAQQVCDVC